MAEFITAKEWSSGGAEATMKMWNKKRITVTREMIQAGTEVLPRWENKNAFTRNEVESMIVEEIYVAMLRASMSDEKFKGLLEKGHSTVERLAMKKDNLA